MLPTVKESVDINAPYHCPNRKPDIIAIGKANPRKNTHKIENIENRKINRSRFFSL